MFGIFKKKDTPPEVEPQFIVVTLNARLQPVHRGELFGDPLDIVLTKEEKGEVSGGGSLQSKTGEIEHCDIEIQVVNSDESTVEVIMRFFEQIGAPKGSKIEVEATNSTVEFGKLEGLAIYLNGTDLDDEVYAQGDSNYVYSELDRLTEGTGKVYSYWQGSTETAFYLYGSTFDEMKAQITELLDTYPLCQKCRVEQIA